MIDDNENAFFLQKKVLLYEKYFEWSDLSPYYTEINGRRRYFRNSYEAHVNKHPLNKKEKEIWEKHLEGYPKNVYKTYIKFSNNLIKKSSFWKYDQKNHSLNFDSDDNMRVSLKRSANNKNKVVISTCHPRIRHNYGRNVNDDALCFFTNSNLEVKKQNFELLSLLFKPNDYNYDIDFFTKTEKIISKYFLSIIKELKILEKYNRKYNCYELTDAFDYDEIIIYIDKLFLCYKFYLKTNPEYKSIIMDLVNTFKRLDKYNNLGEYIDSLFTNIDDDNNNNFKSYFYVLKEEFKNKQEYNAYLVGQVIDYLKDKNIKSKDYLATGKTYQIAYESIKWAQNMKNPRNLSPWDRFVLCKYNMVSKELAEPLLRNPSPILDEVNIKGLLKEWEEPYSDEQMEQRVDQIKEYHQHKKQE